MSTHDFTDDIFVGQTHAGCMNDDRCTPEYLVLISVPSEDGRVNDDYVVHPVPDTGSPREQYLRAQMQFDEMWMDMKNGGDHALLVCVTLLMPGRFKAEPACHWIVCDIGVSSADPAAVRCPLYERMRPAAVGAILRHYKHDSRVKAAKTQSGKDSTQGHDIGGEA